MEQEKAVNWELLHIYYGFLGSCSVQLKNLHTDGLRHVLVFYNPGKCLTFLPSGIVPDAKPYVPFFCPVTQIWKDH